MFTSFILFLLRLGSGVVDAADYAIWREHLG